jgi:NADH:ubiquinone reductase (H+-translocating)
MEFKNVIIVGGGFGGLSAAKKFARKNNFAVTLVDRRNHHLFQPLLYQVATAGLSPAEIASPIRSIVRKARNIRVLLGSVTGVNLQEKFIEMPGERIAYDYLILACGAKHSYFGHDEWEEFAPGLKTLAHATEIRKRILIAFELAEKEGDEERRAALLNFVVVGAGPTGVELAGAIREIATQSMRRDFRAFDTRSAKIKLIEAGPRILAQFNPKLSASAHKDLQRLGVEVLVSTKVIEVNGEGVRVERAGKQEFINARTAVWAAGVLPSSLGKTMGVTLDRAGRVIVEPTLNLKDHPEVFVLGDMASTPDGRGGTLPGLAPVAIQQGRHSAKNIFRMARGKQPLPFHYVDKGQMATIGRSRAVMQYGNRIRMTGFPAWIMWLVVHIYFLIGFRNRFFVFLEWAFAYLTFRRGARLIVD